VISQREVLGAEQLPKITKGSVSVCLVNKDGMALEEKLLESVDGFVKPLDVHTLTTNFSLKVFETSSGDMFRLKFKINYMMEGVGETQEEIISRPFLVYSHKKKNAKEPPVVLALKPEGGSNLIENEVWIKGSCFGDNVCVTFAGMPARIIENVENIITVYAPARKDLTTDEMVEVIVSNSYPTQYLNADKKLYFRYLVK